MPRVKRPLPFGRPRTVRVTGRKFAAPGNVAVNDALGLDPRDGVRPRIALMASRGSTRQLLEAAAVFIDDVFVLDGLAAEADDLVYLLEGVSQTLSRHGVSHSVRPHPVHRLRAPGHNGYPLRRTLLVILNRERGRVTASLTEVAQVLNIQGVGTTEEAAVQDLERRFDHLVRQKVRIPPHTQADLDDAIRSVVNHLVDWKQFDRENPAPQLLWGRVVRRGHSTRPTVHWLVGPEDLEGRTRLVPRRLATPYFLSLADGDWFRGVVLDYSDRVEWLEPPTLFQDPTDVDARRAAWEAIPRVLADKPDAWPLKNEPEISR